MAYTCADCKHFLNGGDFNLCCELTDKLCYKDTPTCKDFDYYRHYEITCNGMTIAHYDDNEHLHPCNVIHMMNNELSERIEKIAREKGELDDE